MPNLNQVWARLMVEELVRCGVTVFFIAPGSRSTPLTVAIAQHPDTRTIVHFDERGTAFAALGYGRATRRPAAWVTTSGTALANGYPAVIEASVSGVPLLLLTADRPPELRDTGANQTIEQPGLFGAYTRWQFDVPTPTLDIPPAFVLTTVDQAVHQTRQTAGPVHLNLMFREPLAPVETGFDAQGYLDTVQLWTERAQPFTRYAASVRGLSSEDARALTTVIEKGQRGLVVLGELMTPAEADTIARWASTLGWPVLADVLSQGRGGGTQPITYHDAILANDVFARAHTPDVVVHFGRRATSKRLLQFLERTDPTYIWVKPTERRLDPRHQTAWQVAVEYEAFCAQVRPQPAAATTWQDAWHGADRAVAQQFRGQFDTEALTEPEVAHALATHLEPTHGLYLAASMPVRDMELVGGRLQAAAIVANRGASGIDGTVASAVGLSIGLNRPVTLLVGDLALLHDLNALALVRQAPHPVTIVVINNDGGGIFSFLPIATHEDVFEPYFGTPHGFTFEHAAAQFGLAYVQPQTMADFNASYRYAATGAATVIEVRTDRDLNHAFHRSLLDGIEL